MHFARILAFAVAFSWPLLAGASVRASDERYFGPDPSAPGWARLKLEHWPASKASTAADLVAGMLAGVMETAEGLADTKVHIWTTGGTFRAAARSHGLADDAIRAQETVIAMRPAGNGWEVTEVWQRWICARGANTRDWTDKPCP